MSSSPSLKERWRLVRGNNLPSRLRHLLLVLMHYQSSNSIAWCKRETLADELGIRVDSVSRQMRQLESLGIVRRKWESRGRQPIREYSIDFDQLAMNQRTLTDGSDSTLTVESICSLALGSECGAPSLTDGSGPVLRYGQDHPDPRVRHEVTNEVTNEEPRARASDDASGSNSVNDSDAPAKSAQQKKRRNSKATMPEMPVALAQSVDFRAAWDNWKRFRREIRKPLTATAVSNQFTLLESLGVSDAIRTINISINSGWTGLFPPRASNNGQSRGSTDNRAAEHVSAIFERLKQFPDDDDADLIRGDCPREIWDVVKQIGLSVLREDAPEAKARFLELAKGAAS